MTSKILFSKEISKIIEGLDFSRLGSNVGIKVHFGERGCTTFMNPKIVKSVYDKVKSIGKNASLIESNVLYRGSRTNSTAHKKVAIEHGFDFAPIEILDGEKGDDFIEIPVSDSLNNSLIDSAKIGKGIEKFDSMIVISHFKGHIAAGYGAVFKNIGMGLGSRAGKLHMHASVSPSIDSDACIGCGKCVAGCDFNAITLTDNKAKINSNLCKGCAMCIAICPVGAVSIPWGTSTNEELQKKIVEYTYAVFKKIPQEKCIFINILENITRDCDCMNKSQKPLMEDVGILASYNPVALDYASIELVEKVHPGIMDTINSIDKTVQIDYASEIGLGEKEYELVELK